MLGLFKKHIPKGLEKKYHALLKEATDLQRMGKIPQYAKKMAEANAVYEEMNQKS